MIQAPWVLDAPELGHAVLSVSPYTAVFLEYLKSQEFWNSNIPTLVYFHLWQKSLLIKK